MTADLLDDGGLEHAPGRLVEGGGVVERGFLGQEHVLCRELALEALQIVAQHLLAIGELPMPGHRFDAEQIGDLDHVATLHDVGKPGALPEIAAVEQQRTLLADLVAQAIDQRLQMGKAAELAEAARGLVELETGEGIGIGAVGADAEPVEEGAADQMRRSPRHLTDADIDTWFAEISRIQLRMRVGDVQDPRIAEPFEVVNARRLGAPRKPRQTERCSGKARALQEITAADRHQKFSAPSTIARRFHLRPSLADFHRFRASFSVVAGRSTLCQRLGFPGLRLWRGRNRRHPPLSAAASVATVTVH